MRQLLAGLFERWTSGARTLSTVLFGAIALPLSWLYRLGLMFRGPRRIRFPALTNSRLIVVSSPLVGGVGKTPVAAYVANALCFANRRTALVTIGYRRRHRGRFVMDEQSEVTAEEMGDEAIDLWLATNVPVHVDDEPGTLIADLGARPDVDAIVFDDGISRIWTGEWRIAVLGAGDLLRQVRYLPFGRWRVPPSYVSQVSYVAITDQLEPRAEHLNGHRRRLREWGFDGPVGWFRSHSDGLAWAAPIQGEPMPPIPDDRPFVFCGLANPGRFLGSVVASGYAPAGVHFFDDHHHYTKEDYDFLITKCRDCGGKWLLTSRKDLVKLSPYEFEEFHLYCLWTTLHQVAGDDLLTAIAVIKQ